MGGGRVSWSGLPKELLTKIGECLDTRFDIIRFRSVCSTWRNSLPFSRRNWHLQLPQHSDPQNPLGLDHEIQLPEIETCYISTTIVRTTVCIINQYPVPSPISSPWLLKFEETKQGKLRIINPISDTPVKDLPATFPNVLNLLDYPILEVSVGYMKEYSILGYVLPPGDAPTVCTSKVVILPKFDTITLADDFIFLNLFESGTLFLGRNGDPDVKPMEEVEFICDDIAFYRERFVAIDSRGILSLVDSSLKLVRLTPPILNGGQKKHLVVSSGHLYAVDRYFDRPRTNLSPYSTKYRREEAKVVAFKVYKLHKEWGWIELTRLDDRILFIGERFNFFVPTKDLSGCRGNYIYFIDENQWYNEDDEFIGSTGPGISVFDMVDQRIGELSSFPGCFNMLFGLQKFNLH